MKKKLVQSPSQNVCHGLVKKKKILGTYYSDLAFEVTDSDVYLVQCLYKVVLCNFPA